MAKKKFLVGMLVGLLAFGMTGTAAFAQPQFQLSAGGGAIVDLAWFGLVDGSQTDGFEGLGWETLPGFGGFVFFDATYLEASIGFSGGKLNYFETPWKSRTEEVSGSFTALNFSLLGKYPFEFGKFSIFPMLGIDYQLFLSAKLEDEEYDDPSELNILWFKVGVGGDFALTEKLYLRGTLLFKFSPIANKFAKNVVASLDSAKPSLSVGGTFKLAVGYKF